MVKEYYEILEVDKTSELVDIKRAYRKKAKLLHPDVNNRPDAHEKFILLNEAYEYFQNRKTGKVYDQKKHAYTKASKRYRNDRAWQQKERENARKRAREHAKMKYEAFTKTRFYQTTVALNVLIDFFSLLMVAFIFIGAPLIGYKADGKTGLLISVIIIIATVQFWARVLFVNRPKINSRELADAFLIIARTRTFQLFFAIVVNLFFLFWIGLSTLLPLSTMAIVFIMAMAIAFAISGTIKNKVNKPLIVFGIAPGLINLFFIVNFLFSSNPVIETYTFIHQRRWYSHGSVPFKETKFKSEKIAFIDLENDTYKDYKGIRIFADFEAMKNKHTISYELADGLFGTRVMKSYTFK